MEINKEHFKEFIKEYRRVQNNAVYFLEKYYNRLHSDGEIELTDEDKQELYSEFRIMIPLIKDEKDWARLNNMEKRRKEKGLKDWEYED